MDASCEVILSKIMDEANVLFIYADSNNKIILCNKKAIELVGKPHQQIIGEDLLETLFPEGITSEKQRLFKLALANASSIAKPCDCESELSTPKAEKRFIYWDINPVTNTLNQPSGIAVIGTDITEKQNCENEVLQAEKLATIGQLVAGLAHEINNPLFVISGRTELLQRKKYLFNNISADLRIIAEQAERIKKLVNRLLNFSRRQTINFVPLDINSAIEAALPFLSYQKKLGPKFEIEKNFAQGIPRIKGDLNQLQEVFINLFLNAADAMPDGGKLGIKTGYSGNGYASIEISDTGTGISEEELKNIFMPFFSTKKTGSGLGLSISYNIIRNHGGTIELKTKKGSGTTFIIKLPTQEKGGDHAVQSIDR